MINKTFEFIDNLVEKLEGKAVFRADVIYSDGKFNYKIYSNNGKFSRREKISKEEKDRKPDFLEVCRRAGYIQNRISKVYGIDCFEYERMPSMMLLSTGFVPQEGTKHKPFRK